MLTPTRVYFGRFGSKADQDNANNAAAASGLPRVPSQNGLTGNMRHARNGSQEDFGISRLSGEYRAGDAYHGPLA